MEEENRVQIYINKKEIKYSHQNIVATINSFLPYLTNDDLDEMMKTFVTLKEHRRQKEHLTMIEVKKHSWPYPNTINKNDTT
tara:strand:- start:1161 stop:1406 length:246 start_codon:yes stop_codon:yes gene_type:complete